MADKTVVVRLVAQTGPYVVGMNQAGQATGKLGREVDQVGDKTGKFGGKMDGLKTAAAGMAVAGGAIVATKLVSFLSEATAAAGDLQQSIGGVDAVFGDTADAIHEFGENSAEAVGLSKNEFNELVTVTGALLKNKGLEDFTDKSLDLVEVGADLAATFGGSTKDAVEALNAAMRGESDPIERYGISLNETAVNAELAAKGLGKLEGAALEQEKAQARIDIVMRQSADSIGAFARESDTLQGQQQRLNAEWEDAKATLGEALLPALTDAVSMMRDGVDVVLAVASAFESIPKPVLDSVAAFTPLLQSFAQIDGWLGPLAEKSREFTEAQEAAGVSAEESSIKQVAAYEGMANKLGEAGLAALGLTGLLGLLEVEQSEQIAKTTELSDGLQVSGERYQAQADAIAASRDAAGEAGPVLDELGRTEEELAEVAKETREAHDLLREAILGVVDAAFSAIDADIAYEAALDSLSESVKENGRSHDITTEAGRRNQAALVDVAEAARRNAEAQLQNGESLSYVQGEMNDARDAFIRGAEQMGYTTEQANALADELGMTAGQVSALRGEIGALPAGKDINVRVITTHITRGTAGGATAHWVVEDGGIISPRASGGFGQDILGRVIPREPMLGGPRHGKRFIMWGEDSTHEEAYISRKPGMEARNKGIAETAVGWFGGKVTWAADGAWMRPTPYVQTATPMTGGGSALDLASVAAAVAAAMPERLEAVTHIDGVPVARATFAALSRSGGRINTGPSTRIGRRS